MLQDRTRNLLITSRMYSYPAKEAGDKNQQTVKLSGVFTLRIWTNLTKFTVNTDQVKGL